MQPEQTAGKCARKRHDWFWFLFLVEKVARGLQTNHKEHGNEVQWKIALDVNRRKLVQIGK